MENVTLTLLTMTNQTNEDEVVVITRVVFHCDVRNFVLLQVTVTVIIGVSTVPYTVYSRIPRALIRWVPVPVSVQWSQKVMTGWDGVYTAVYGTFTGAESCALRAPMTTHSLMQLTCACSGHSSI